MNKKVEVKLGVAIATADGRFLDASPEFLEMLHITEDALLKSDLTGMCGAEFMQQVEKSNPEYRATVEVPWSDLDSTKFDVKAERTGDGLLVTLREGKQGHTLR